MTRLLSFSRRLLGGLLRPGRASCGIFFVTDLCNAKCPYCFNTRLGHLSDHVPAEKSGTRLSAEEYRAVARNMRPLFQAVLGGGEPFLRGDIVELAEIFYGEAGARLISIPTNGAVEGAAGKAEDMARRCPRATFNIMVSLDAFGERHDRLRALPGGFEKALRLCDALIEARRRAPNLNLVVNTAVTAENRGDVEELSRRLAARFAGRPWLHNLQYEQRANAAAVAAAGLPRAADAAGSWAGRLLARGYVDFINGLVREQLAAGRMLYRCNAGRKVLVMMPDGELSACEPFFFDPHYAAFPRWNVRDHGYDPRRIQDLPEFRRMRRFIEERSCKACPWSVAAITSMTYSPSNWPLFLKRTRPARP